MLISLFIVLLFVIKINHKSIRDSYSQRVTEGTSLETVLFPTDEEILLLSVPGPALKPSSFVSCEYRK